MSTKALKPKPPPDAVADPLQRKRDAAIRRREQERLAAAAEVRARKAAAAKQRATEEAKAEAKRAQSASRKQHQLNRLQDKRDANVVAREQVQMRRAQHAATAVAQAKPQAGDRAKSDVLLLKSLFDTFDRDRTGSVRVAELRQASASSPSGTGIMDTVDPLFAAMDREGDGSVTFEGLLRVLYPRASEGELSHYVGWAEPAGKRRPLRPEDMTEIAQIFHEDADAAGELAVEALLAELDGTNLSEASINVVRGLIGGKGDKGKVGLRAIQQMASDAGAWSR
tara:strand:- start:906 stop:1751 length:846 start_codon:yes stop_codon:yes gene_type:complete